MSDEQQPTAKAAPPAAPSFCRGDVVRKRSGSAWTGRVVGEYSTALTPEGYAVESDAHPGSVQIYPAAALELLRRGDKTALAGGKGERRAEESAAS